jgi:hypothetical protein
MQMARRFLAFRILRYVDLYVKIHPPLQIKRYTAKLDVTELDIAMETFILGIAKERTQVLVMNKETFTYCVVITKMVNV